MQPQVLVTISAFFASLSIGIAQVHAEGGNKTKAKDKSEVDIRPVKKDLIVLHDGQGHYVVFNTKGRMYDHLYYGDGKVFYQQRVFGGGHDLSRGQYSRSFWSPRIRRQRSGRPHGYLFKKDKKTPWEVQCGPRKTKMRVLGKSDTRRILDNGIFKKPYWKRRAYALARNDRGNYYYVDRFRDEYGGKGFRLFVGQRGNMKQRKMINIVSDSEGDIFSTRTGELRLILNRKDAVWVNKKKRQRLTYVPINLNAALIYADLGVYLAFLGTPCDDL